MKNKTNFEIIFADTLKCNHCGLCLQNCPAYRTYKEEISSPRGRVQIAKFLAQKKLDINKDEAAILKAVETCKNCFNCTVLCPAGISPQSINTRLKELLDIEPQTPQKHTFKNLLFKIYFRDFFTKKANLFLTSSSDFKQVKQILETLKQNNFESSLYKEIIVRYSLENLPDFKNYIFDDIENYRLAKTAAHEGKIKINEKQILFITQAIKPHTITLPQDGLIIYSNVFLNQEMLNDRQKLFANFKNKSLNFVNNRYYFGPNFQEKTVEYLKQVPQNILITLSERENIFLKKLIKKYKLNKKVISISQIYEI